MPMLATRMKNAEMQRVAPSNASAMAAHLPSDDDCVRPSRFALDMTRPERPLSASPERCRRSSSSLANYQPHTPARKRHDPLALGPSGQMPPAANSYDSPNRIGLKIGKVNKICAAPTGLTSAA